MANRLKIDKAGLVRAQEGLCALCGGLLENSNTEVHHAGVYKSDAGVSQQHTVEASINDPINLLAVHGDPCHQTLQPNRRLSQFLLVEIHGGLAVLNFMQKMLPRTWQTVWRM